MNACHGRDRKLVGGVLAAVLALGPAARGLDAAPPRPVAAGLPAAEAAQAMTAPPGFSVKLLAAEPEVCQPIAMCFDDRGRLLVVECYAYPHKLPAA